MFGIVMSGKYWTFEKITLFFCLFNLVYIPAAIWAMQTGNVADGWAAVGRGFYSPQFQFSASFTPAALITLIMANIGTTITPWQIFFQQIGRGGQGDGRPRHQVRQDRHLRRLAADLPGGGVHHHRHGGRVLLSTRAGRSSSSRPPRRPNRCPRSCPPTTGASGPRLLFAIGLFDAGLLGALCISLSTSWAVGEVFGWAHSLNKSVREAPWFYVVYLLMLLSAGVVSLVASIDVQNAITIFVQVVAVTLLPAALVFLILLLNDKPLMGEYVNTRWQNIANWAIVDLRDRRCPRFSASRSCFPSGSGWHEGAAMTSRCTTRRRRPATPPARAKDYRFYYFSELLEPPGLRGQDQRTASAS